jgi:hypothetical protein
MHMAARVVWVAWAAWICKSTRPIGQPVRWITGGPEGRTGDQKAPLLRGFLFCVTGSRVSVSGEVLCFLGRLVACNALVLVSKQEFLKQHLGELLHGCQSI